MGNQVQGRSRTNSPTPGEINRRGSLTPKKSPSKYFSKIYANEKRKIEIRKEKFNIPKSPVSYPHTRHILFPLINRSFTPCLSPPHTSPNTAST